MKKLYFLAAAAALIACSENPTQPNVSSPTGPALTVLTPAGVNQLVCFTFGGGVCTTSADHKKAVLTNTSTDPSGDISGVQSFDPTVYGEYLWNITELSYTYKGTIIPPVGNLAYIIPIDADNNGSWDFDAVADAMRCGAKASATVNIVTMANCEIWDGGTFYQNWAAFVAAYPSAVVQATGEYIRIAAPRAASDPAAIWQISNVKFGKTGLICSDGHTDGTNRGGVCTLGSDFKSATLDNSESNSNGVSSSVYSRERQAYGLFISNVHDLTYKYRGTTVPSIHNLVYSIPIDLTGDGQIDAVASAEATLCRGTPSANGIYTVNITRDATCQILLEPGGTLYANWAAFVAANPNARIASTWFDGSDTFMKLSAFRAPYDDPAVWSIISVNWGKKGK